MSAHNLCWKCRRECDLSRARVTLCGDRVSSARNAGESAICPMCAQPSAEIVRVECAKCRRECDLSAACTTLCGDRAGRARELQARVRFVPTSPTRAQPDELATAERNFSGRSRGVSGELEDETSDLVVQLEYTRSIWGAGRGELATL